jgi:hypothetical protein
MATSATVVDLVWMNASQLATLLPESASMPHLLAGAVHEPGKRLLLIDESNHNAGWCDDFSELPAGHAYAVLLRNEFLAFDLDGPGHIEPREISVKWLESVGTVALLDRDR